MVKNLQNKERYPSVCFDILSYIEKNLCVSLTYHSIFHTIDVANVCDGYINYYAIDKDNADLIRIAAISHDIGYLISPVDHEELGIKEVRPFIEKILNERQIATIDGMIRATKVPQNPTTFYEEIIADADLDYLGRNDYDELSAKLFKEFTHFNVVKTEKEWLNLQVTFLGNHSYHTAWAKENRNAHKILKLKELKEKLI